MVRVLSGALWARVVLVALEFFLQPVHHPSLVIQRRLLVLAANIFSRKRYFPQLLTPSGPERNAPPLRHCHPVREPVPSGT